MSKNRVPQPNFKLSFLLPQFWPIWLLMMISYLISWLPYRLQLFMGKMLGRLFLRFSSSRKKVALRNIALCFPDMPDDEKYALLKRNFENTGIAIFETGMGWWWPQWRVKRKSTVIGAEHIEKAQQQGKGILLLAFHNVSIEMNCRCIGYTHPMVVFYRPHNNPLMEYFQFRGRGQSNKYMLGKKDVKGLIQALKEGDACIYLPDQDYGRKKSVFVPFFAVKETATTTGTLIFARQNNIQVHIVIPTRNQDGSGYTIEVKPQLNDFPTGNDINDVTRINQLIEKEILLNPEQYLWLHRRFKTRPNPDDPSLYK